ncbi:hypothetical protein BJ508DRAFT_40025 [Ascobolus immersus RN42]|uniref:Uncharacterized protein n=1 Tax=Ascobolus immersus RN42 TaxID=1160509 RepID=A0A3N4HMJ2_ASCIM|nr:hypothetical protein BJ508DRAFT_40025 [Ascobolus immersus RN42]
MDPQTILQTPRKRKEKDQLPDPSPTKQGRHGLAHRSPTKRNLDNSPPPAGSPSESPTKRLTNLRLETPRKGRRGRKPGQRSKSLARPSQARAVAPRRAHTSLDRKNSASPTKGSSRPPLPNFSPYEFSFDSPPPSTSRRLEGSPPRLDFSRAFKPSISRTSSTRSAKSYRGAI